MMVELKRKPLGARENMDGDVSQLGVNVKWGVDTCNPEMAVTPTLI